LTEASVFYDEQWAELGDFIRYNPGARHRRRIVAQVLRGIEFESVLDVGCGPGEMLLWIKRSFPSVESLWGADIALATIGNNRVRIPWAWFERLDIEQERIGREFALVICSEVVEHLRDRRGALRNLAAMVRPGGHLLVTCPTGRVFATEVSFGHVTHPTVDELRALGVEVGLDTVRYEQWGWPTYRLTKILANLRPEWAMEQFGRGRYSIVKRLVSGCLYWLNFANLKHAASGCQVFWLYRKPTVTHELASHVAQSVRDAPRGPGPAERRP
jgi:SAM-dependent methyltransferase